MKLYRLVYLFLCMLCLNMGNAFASEDPSSMIQNIADQMIAGLHANQATLKTKPQLVYDLAHKYVVPHAALPLMARHVLPRNVWNNATEAQKSEFIKEFTRTLIRTYASALAAYRDQKVHVYPMRGDPRKTVEINSEITSGNHDPIHVSYRLVHVGTAWELFDLSVEGVSMLESFRSQFSDILSRGDIDVLLKRMNGHNNHAA